jgi:hypothetical protein
MKEWHIIKTGIKSFTSLLKIFGRPIVCINITFFAKYLNIKINNSSDLKQLFFFII